MSRSRHQSRGRKVSSCACGRCSGFKAQPRALDVAGDLAANDHLHWTESQDIGGWEWFVECEHCGSDVTFYVCECRDASAVTPPLRAPLAEIARAA